MITFEQFVESIRMPRTMGTAQKERPPVPDRMQAWSVEYKLSDTDVPKRTQVTAQSELEVRRMLWEFLRMKYNPQSILQSARTAVINSIPDFDWERMAAPARPKVAAPPQYKAAV